MVNEFLLVQLIKYRYPEHYRSLYKKEYLRIDSSLKTEEELKIEKNAYEILERLFRPNPLSTYNPPYKHIYEWNGFDNYFNIQISGSLRVADIEKLFSLPWNKVTNTIDGWITNKKSYDFIDYLNRLYKNNFNNEEFLRYAEMVTYIAYKDPKPDAYELFTKIIYIEYLKANNIKTKSERTNYKNRLLGIIEGNDPQLISRIHYEYKKLRKNEDEYLIKDNDIRPLIKEKFIQTTKDDSADEIKLYKLLLQCIDTRRDILDKECLKAYRQRVEKNPDYYIKKFVRLSLKTSRPDLNSIVCEPFWKQIFGNKTQFEAFLTQCKKDNIEKSELAWNFWLLYKANNYKHIKFENQGNVQEKIDNNLIEEVKKLEEMQKIEVKVYQIPDNCKSNQHKVVYKKFLLKYKKELNDIKLNISLNGKIRKAIDDKLKNLSN